MWVMTITGDLKVPGITVFICSITKITFSQLIHEGYCSQHTLNIQNVPIYLTIFTLVVVAEPDPNPYSESTKR